MGLCYCSCCSVSHIWLFVTPWTEASPVLHHLPEFAQTQIHCISDAIQPSCPLLLLPSVFPSIRVFSNESALCIRWPKYWSFSFSVSSSNEYSGLISFAIDWFYFLAVQGFYTLKDIFLCAFSTYSISLGILQIYVNPLIFIFFPNFILH